MVYEFEVNSCIRICQDASHSVHTDSAYLTMKGIVPKTLYLKWFVTYSRQFSTPCLGGKWIGVGCGMWRVNSGNLRGPSWWRRPGNQTTGEDTSWVSAEEIAFRTHRLLLISPIITWRDSAGVWNMAMSSPDGCSTACHHQGAALHYIHTDTVYTKKYFGIRKCWNEQQYSISLSPPSCVM